MQGLCALSVALLMAVAESRSILIPSRFEAAHGGPEQQQQQQQPLDRHGPRNPTAGLPPPQHVTALQHFDARENSVGVLFTSSERTSEGLVHLWLPLGTRVFTRESPILPLHPVTARITTSITTTPSLAAAEQLERIECEIWTTSERGKVTFSRRDELVHFGRENDERFWLAGEEVESYECHS